MPVFYGVEELKSSVVKCERNTYDDSYNLPPFSLTPKISKGTSYCNNNICSCQIIVVFIVVSYYLHPIDVQDFTINNDS